MHLNYYGSIPNDRQKNINPPQKHVILRSPSFFFA